MISGIKYTETLLCSPIHIMFACLAGGMFYEGQTSYAMFVLVLCAQIGSLLVLENTVPAAGYTGEDYEEHPYNMEPIRRKQPPRKVKQTS